MLNLKHQWRRLTNRLKWNKIGRLPVELYSLIIEQVERSEDLYNLLFVCGDFHFTAEKVLYRNLHLKDQPQRPSSHLQLFQTIISSKRIASHIHSLTISGLHVDAANPWSILNQALCAIPNLKKLYWLVDEASWPHSTLGTLSGCVFQLHTLVFHAYLSLDTTFLNLQSELVELDMRGFSIIYFPPNVFPKLTTLTVSCRETARFIDKPSLRALYPLDPLFLAAPLPNLIHITSLRLPHSSTDENFSRIIYAFPRLRFLRIDNILIPRFIPSISWHELLEYLLTDIAHPTTLEKLSLHFLVTQPRIAMTSIPEMAFKSLRDLQVITFEEVYMNTCVQWVRGTKGQQVIKANVEEWQDKSWH